MKVNGTLAQLVEHRAFNPLVEGSNPSRPTRHSIFVCFSKPQQYQPLSFTAPL